MKKIAYILLILIASATALEASYWEKITNLPDGYKYNYWLDIYFHPTNTNYGWACGFNGQVVRTTDGGATWKGSTVLGAYHLESIHFATLRIGYTSGVEGIFKSTDGGATWLNITPDPLESYWGCYFIDANTGLVVGGGCGDDVQRFYKTTNGGASWTLFEGYEFNSGMTDLLLYPDGTGYAVSSGVLWRSTDMGSTWSVHSITGSKVWQEEITHIGNSFLLPTAGVNCAGSGGVGGIRFSTNNGVSWNRTEVRDAMFGSFLINTTSGWACGYDGQVYYTSDAGISWQELSCGVDDANLDDIWFNSHTDGWVVGDGIWRLAPSSARVSPQNLDFGDVCQGETKRDTVWVTNLSFDDASAQIALTGDGAENFLIVSPTSSVAYISSCDSIPIIVQFNPVSLGIKFCNLSININSKQFNVPIVAKSVVSTISANSYEAEINPAFCGFPNFTSISWTSKDADNITAIRKTGGSELIESLSYLPITVGNSPKLTTFGCNPIDTGWVETYFEVEAYPCDYRERIKISAYGVSPIINVPENVSVYANCLKDTLLSIPVFNTGNRKLLIASVHLTNESEFEVVGWQSGSGYPIGIAQQATDTLLIKFSSNAPGSFATDVYLENNDSTKVRGRKNPSIVRVFVQTSYPYLEVSKLHVDFGNVCVGDSRADTIAIKNNGNIKAKLAVLSRLDDNFSYNINPLEIDKFDSIQTILNFAPKVVGKFRDTIRISAEPCNSVIELSFEGFAIDNSIEISPNSFEIFAQTGTEIELSVDITSHSNVTQYLNSVRAVTINEGLSFTLQNSLPQAILSGESIELNFALTPNRDSIFEFELCLDFGNDCPQTICLPIRLVARHRLVAIDRDSISFRTLICDSKPLIEKVVLTNLVVLADTIVAIGISPENSYFRIKDMPSLPTYLAANEKLELSIEYFPLSEGDHFAELIIETKEPAPQILKVSLNGRFEKAASIASRDSINFGYVESCISEVLDSVTFTNIGLRADTLSISHSGSIAFATQPSRELIVLPNDSAKIYIKATISELEGVGLHTANIKLKSKVCGDEYSILASAELIVPKLLISPNPINFEDVWMNDEKELEFSISNASQVPIEYEILGIEPESSDFSIDLAKGFLTVGEKNVHLAKFSALKEGQHAATLIVRQKTACDDTFSIELLARVPEEIYYPKFIIGDHKAVPGDTVGVLVYLDSAILRATPKAAEFSIAFDRFLFEPEKVEKLYMVRSPVDFTFSKDLLSFRLDSSQSVGLLAEAGKKFLISGIALLSNPDSTALAFRDIKIMADKELSPLKKDGSLSLYGYCRPSNIGIRLLPTAELNFVSSGGETVKIVINSSSGQAASISSSDAIGRYSQIRSLKLAGGENIIELPTYSFPSGLQYLIIETEGGQIFTEKLIIVR